VYFLRFLFSRFSCIINCNLPDSQTSAGARLNQKGRRMSETQSGRPREKKDRGVSSRLEKSLGSYALAAVAAGAGVLSCSEPAEARIISSEVNVNIPLNGGVIQFDINGDGVPDFGLSNHIYEFAGAPPLGDFSSWLKVIPAQAGNEVWAVSSRKDQCAAAVRAGLNIDNARPFKPEALIMVEAVGNYTNGRSSHCPWHGAHPPYLGLKFLINGEIHYGWARVATAERTATLTGFAYETIPNKSIAAGATKEASIGQGDDSSAQGSFRPRSLGSLALGTHARDVWKKREEEQPG
jgi:hypothetical protein